MVSYIGRFAPAVACSLASVRGGEPATELTSSRSNTTNGDATLAPLGRPAGEASVVSSRGRLVLAYCLMGNHYHLLAETLEGRLAVGMRQLNGVYAQWFNRRHGRVGHLFQGRYLAKLVQADEHVLQSARYIIRNPVAPGLCASPRGGRGRATGRRSGACPAAVVRPCLPARLLRAHPGACTRALPSACRGRADFRLSRPPACSLATTTTSPPCSIASSPRPGSPSATAGHRGRRCRSCSTLAPMPSRSPVRRSTATPCGRSRASSA